MFYRGYEGVYLLGGAEMKKTRRQTNNKHAVDMNILDAKGAQSVTFFYPENNSMNREARRSYEKEKKRQDRLLGDKK